MIGIDFGTTNSAVGHPTGAGLEIVANARGDRLTPSVVAFDGETALVGTQAENQAVQYPERTVFSVKRYLGTDEEILLGDGNTKSAFTPEEAAGLILKKLREDAEASLGRSVERAVITVPAYFNDRQRQATKHAGEIAGLSVERILNEPTAACLAYGLRTGTEQTVLVYDLGGGTFDSSLIDVGGGVFEVLATNGDTNLGGDDWDARIVDWVEERLVAEYNATLDDPVSTERVFDAAKQAKHELSTRKRTQLTLPFLELEGESYDVEQTLTRTQFERLTHDLTEETIALCDALFAETAYTPATVDEVLLVGGSTRMAQVKNRVAEYIGTDPVTRVNPDEAVALGAAAQAAILDDDTLPAPENNPTVTTHTEAGEPPKSGGSAAVPTRDASDIVLLTVTPQSVGIEVADEPLAHNTVYDALIPRNTSIPVTETEMYTTLEDRQEFVNITVYQGDGTLAENELLDEFEIGPIPLRPAGEPQIEVSFSIDQDGLLQVSAEDIDHAIGDEIAIESVFGLTPKEISSMGQNLPDIR